MGLNATPMANRTHIGFFGRRNVGKSSLVNAITGQSLSVVSDTAGTTTDPVRKTMELLPIGPVVIIDTPGYDDVGELGQLRVKKTVEILQITDLAVLVIDAQFGKQKEDIKLIQQFEENEVPYVVLWNKMDLLEEKEKIPENEIYVSAIGRENIEEAKELIAKVGQEKKREEKWLVKDLVDAQEGYVVLVVPIDESAPKGRLILPQQQVLRELLELRVMTIVVQPEELPKVLQNESGIQLVITDSQKFEEVSKMVPETVPLTSFSILMARYKGFLQTALQGIQQVKCLQDGDKVLISEGCTHHRQCKDIGSVKIPNWLRKHTKKQLEITLSAGREFPEDLSQYAMVIHCGGCMLPEKEVERRKRIAEKQKIPFVNYGILIAHMKGILTRCINNLPQ